MENCIITLVKTLLQHKLDGGSIPVKNDKHKHSEPETFVGAALKSL